MKATPQLFRGKFPGAAEHQSVALQERLIKSSSSSSTIVRTFLEGLIPTIRPAEVTWPKTAPTSLLSVSSQDTGLQEEANEKNHIVFQSHSVMNPMLVWGVHQSKGDFKSGRQTTPGRR